LLVQNPIAEYKLAKPERVPKPVPTLAQVGAILSKCNATLMPRIQVLACTGMRVGELQGLRKTDVDLKNRFITVANQVFGPTKTRSSVRRIPIHARIRRLFETQLAAGEHELLFTAQPSRRYPTGGHFVNVKRMNDDFKAAVKKAALSGFTLHSLRRFFNTTAVNAGVPERVVRCWMGHASHDMTGRYYALTDEDSRKFMDTLSFELTSETKLTADSAEKGDPS
jgi:integrase